MNECSILFSLRRRFSRAILSGEKRYELRRVAPRRSNLKYGLVYETNPTSAIIGMFSIGEILEDSPDAIWERVKTCCGVSKPEFYAYFVGKSIATAIEILAPKEFPRAIPLYSLADVTPPQSYRYISQRDTAQLLSQLKAPETVLELSYKLPVSASRCFFSRAVTRPFLSPEN